MNALHHAWNALLGDLGAPLRLIVFSVLAGLVLTRLLPPALRWTGQGIEHRAGQFMMLLTYPEFVTTSLLRRSGREPLPGTFAYGQALGLATTGCEAAGRRMADWGRRRLAFPTRPFLVGCAWMLLIWYVAGLPMGGPIHDGVSPIRAELTQVDLWLRTGEWSPPLSESCGPLN